MDHVEFTVVICKELQRSWISPFPALDFRAALYECPWSLQLAYGYEVRFADLILESINFLVGSQNK